MSEKQAKQDAANIIKAITRLRFILQDLAFAWAFTTLTAGWGPWAYLGREQYLAVCIIVAILYRVCIWVWKDSRDNQQPS